MKAIPENPPRAGFAFGIVAICVGFHLMADLLLISSVWFLEHEHLLVVISLPLSQCSLAAVWAASSNMSTYVRFAAAPAGAVAAWYMLTQILPWGIGEPVSAAWAIALAIQTFTIVVAIRLYRSLLNLRARPGEEPNHPIRSLFSYDLLTLMLWTTVLAFGAGFIRYGQVQWGWTAGGIDWDYSAAILIIGVFNALLAVLWVWAFAVGQWRWGGVRAMIVVCLIGLLAVSTPYVIDWITRTTAITVRDTLTLATAQSFFLVITLAVVLVGTRMRVLKADSTRSSRANTNLSTNH